MEPFTLSGPCRSGHWCATCRDPAARWWRESLRPRFSLPDDNHDFACPYGKPWRPNPYHALWAELHTKRDADREWLDAFTRRIPCGECHAEFKAMLARTPPVFGEGFFAWTVDRHNEVNAKLNKPLVSVEHAERLWRPVPIE